MSRSNPRRKIDILQNDCSAEYQADLMMKIFEKIPLKNFNFSKIAGLQPATLIIMEHFHRQILIGLVMIWNSYCVEDPSGGL